MKKYLVEIIVCVIVLAAGIGGVYSVRKYNQTTFCCGRPDNAPTKPMQPNPSSISVQATKTYSNGAHHISGTVSLPTPCHKLAVDAVTMESYPEQVIIKAVVTDPGNPCVQVIDERAWSIDVKASEQATFRMTINGEAADVAWLPV